MKFDFCETGEIYIHLLCIQKGYLGKILGDSDVMAEVIRNQAKSEREKVHSSLRPMP